jgi:hypothetical protein
VLRREEEVQTFPNPHTGRAVLADLNAVNGGRTAACIPCNRDDQQDVFIFPGFG